MTINIPFRFAGKEVVVCGDGHCDSPGSSAKYCTYTIMDSESGTILHFETVDKREVNFKSPNMELEGLKRCLLFLQSHCIKVSEITTDASTSIISFLGKSLVKIVLHVHVHVATSHPEVFHSLDVWHKAKKLRKALN